MFVCLKLEIEAIVNTIHFSDTTIPNQPWTIFGITSFGDGCGKRNKFGIYAKVPNYVDWIWSVINCNGNCNATSSIF